VTEGSVEATVFPVTTVFPATGTFVVVGASNTPGTGDTAATATTAAAAALDVLNDTAGACDEWAELSELREGKEGTNPDADVVGPRGLASVSAIAKSALELFVGDGETGMRVAVVVGWIAR